MGAELLLLVGFVIVLAIILMLFFVSRYIKCPAGKILVVHGKVVSDTGYDVYAGGAVFVFPIIQSYSLIDLAIYRFDFYDKIYTKDNISIKPKIGISFTVSTRPEVMNVAAKMLLGSSTSEVFTMGESIIREEIQRYYKSKDVVDIATDIYNDKSKEALCRAFDKNLNLVGLEVINIDLRSVNGLEEQISVLEHSSLGQKDVGEDTKDRLLIIEESIIRNAEERRRLLSEKLSLLMKSKS